ncbi:MAG: HAMP domain-containing sensor histidine kinase [Pseudomonadota bacterium]
MKQVEAVIRTFKFCVSSTLIFSAITADASAQPIASTPAYTPWAIGFYSFAITIVLIFLLLNIAVKNRPGLYISALNVGMLLSIWMLEDGLIGWLPSMGRPLNDSFVLFVGQLTCTIGFISAAQVYHPDKVTKTIKTLLWSLALASTMTIPVLWLLQDFTLWMGVANTSILIMIASMMIATSTWRTHDARRRIVPALTAGLALTATAGIIFLYVVSDGRAWIEQGAILRIFFVIVAFPTMLAVLLELNDMRKDRDQALVSAVDAARRDAKTSADLLDMEKQYARAREVADARTRQLSTASHDIRQPIASMRAELDALRGDESDTPMVDRLERALDHLNDLTSDLSRAGTRSPEAGLHGDVEAETLGVNVLLDTLDKLFAAEAQSSGIEFKTVHSSAKISVPPLILIRIVSNLITNAIMHSDAHKILLGVRQRDGCIRLDVIDNGKGFEDGSADWAFEIGEKGSQSPGTGQGLSIVKELADKYGIDLQVWTKPDVGTRVSISLPTVADPN